MWKSKGEPVPVPVPVKAKKEDSQMVSIGIIKEFYLNLPYSAVIANCCVFFHRPSTYRKRSDKFTFRPPEGEGVRVLQRARESRPRVSSPSPPSPRQEGEGQRDPG